MSPLAKLAGFGCALALIGGGSALAGSRLDVHPGRAAAEEKAAGMGAMGEPEHAASDVRGPAVSDRGLTLELDRTRAPRGRKVTLKAGPDLAFTVTRHGRPVPLDDYLGAKGHLVALREGDLAFLHVHPDERRLRFMAEFPGAGRYRLFLQFKTERRIHTAAFTREVGR